MGITSPFIFKYRAKNISLAKNPKFSRAKLAIFILIFAGLGGYLIFHSFAASIKIWDTQADFQSGTLSGTTATSDGHVTLTPNSGGGGTISGRVLHKWDFNADPQLVVDSIDGSTKWGEQAASNSGARNSGCVTESSTTPDRITSVSIGGLNWARLRTMPGDNCVSGSGTGGYRADLIGDSNPSGLTDSGENNVRVYSEVLMVRPGTDYIPAGGNWNTIGIEYHRGGAGWPGADFDTFYSNTDNATGNSGVFNPSNITSGAVPNTPGALSFGLYGGHWPSQSTTSTPDSINMETWQMLPPGSWTNKAVQLAWRIKWHANQNEPSNKTFFKDYNNGTGTPTDLANSGWIELQYRIGSVGSSSISWGSWQWYDGGTVKFANGGQQKWSNGPVPYRHYRPMAFWYDDTQKMDNPYWKLKNYHSANNKDSSVYVAQPVVATDSFTAIGLSDPDGSSSGTTYPSSGTITLPFDAGQNATWSSLSSTDSKPAGTSISYQARSSTDNSNWSAWSSDVKTLPAGRYIQVKANLSTTDSSATPSIDKLSLTYDSGSTALPKPSIPTGLTATPGDGSVSLKWNDNPSSEQVDSYQVYLNNTGYNLNVTGTSFNVPDLTNGTSYSFRISAHNSTGYGDWTAAMNVTPVSSTASSLIGDINKDNKVDILDLSLLLSNWDTTNAVSDLNSDGTISILDLSILLSNYGQTATAVSCPGPGSNTFSGCYYNGTNFESLVLSRTDSAINFDWPSGNSPGTGVNSTQFSARWQGNFNFNSASYTFNTTTDDGMRLYVDGSLVIDQWHDQYATDYSATKSMTSGSHLIKVEYYNDNGGGTAKVSWSQGSTGGSTTNATELWHRFTVSDWPNIHKGDLSTVTNTQNYAQPAGSPTANWIRYYLKDGSLWNNTERVEGSNDHGPNPNFTEGDVAWFRWWEILDQFPVYGGDWNIIFQTHLPNGSNQPTLIFALDANRRLEFKTSSGGGHTLQWNSTDPIALKQPFKIKLGVKFSKDTANGWVELWVNDVNVLPRKAVATLGTNTDPTWDNVYLKQGLYRNSTISGDALLYVNGLQVFDSDPEL